jgi:hypothetical protein
VGSASKSREEEKLEVVVVLDFEACKQQIYWRYRSDLHTGERARLGCM